MSTDDGGALRAGDTLVGRYTLVALIGQGGFGRVYRARNANGGPDVAIKVLHDADPSAVARFEQEASIVLRLTSPHTVRLQSYGSSPHGPFMVLELLDGTSVLDVLRRRRKLPPRVALAITAQVLQSLHEAHGLGIVHRDIKPGNVLLLAGHDDEPRIKVLDFGIAKRRGAAGLTVQGELLGTPHYMAPEQMLGGTVDGRTDLYAVGLLLAEMVSGRLVMGKGGPRTILRRLAEDGPVPLEDDVVESIVGAIVEQAVDKDPSARFQSAAQMLEAVSSTLAQLPASMGTSASRSHLPGFAAAPAPFAPSAPPSATAFLPPAQMTASVPLLPIAPRPRRGGAGAPPWPTLLVLLAVVAGAATTAALVLSTSSEPRRRQSSPELPRAPGPGPRRPRSSDPTVLHELLSRAGYLILVDDGNGVTHTLAVSKGECAGTVTIMTQADEAAATQLASTMSGLDQTAEYLVDGKKLVTINLGTSHTPTRACTAAVTSLLVR